MTIRETISRELNLVGLWPQGIEKIMDEVVEYEKLAEIKGRWNDDVSGYPAEMLAPIWMSVAEVAIQWIDKNKPDHLARRVLAKYV